MNLAEQVRGGTGRTHIGKMVAAPAKSALAPWMMTRGRSEPSYLGLIGMSATALRDDPYAIPTDNGPKFTGKAMMMWAHRQGLEQRLLEPAIPNQHAYVKGLNGRLGYECTDNISSLLSITRSTGSRLGDVTTTSKDREDHWAGWHLRSM